MSYKEDRFHIKKTDHLLTSYACWCFFNQMFSQSESLSSTDLYTASKTEDVPHYVHIPIQRALSVSVSLAVINLKKSVIRYYVFLSLHFLIIKMRKIAMVTLKGRSGDPSENLWKAIFWPKISAQISVHIYKQLHAFIELERNIT